MTGELALRLTPQMIEEIRRRVARRKELSEKRLDNGPYDVIDLGEIKEDS